MYGQARGRGLRRFVYARTYELVVVSHDADGTFAIATKGRGRHRHPTFPFREFLGVQEESVIFETDVYRMRAV